MRTVTLDELPGLVGSELAVSGWLLVDQDRINRFAQVTGDHQWIHVDAARAAAGPFGRTIAHGFLTLSLLPVLFADAVTVQSGLAINYGLDRVRFPQPLPADSRVRGRFTLKSLTPVPSPAGDDTGYQVVMTATVEAEGIDKPVCVADLVTRRYR